MKKKVFLWILVSVIIFAGCTRKPGAQTAYSDEQISDMLLETINKTFPRMYGLVPYMLMDFDFSAAVLARDNNAFMMDAVNAYFTSGYEESGTTPYYIFPAVELRTFAAEFYGINLPSETAGVLEYDKDADTFKLPASDPPIYADCFVVDSIERGDDGTVTAGGRMLYLPTLNDINTPDKIYPNNKGKTFREYGPGDYFGVHAKQKITFRINKDSKYVPVQLIKIISEVNDWDKAIAESGRFAVSDGSSAVHFALSRDASGGNIIVSVVDENSEMYEITLKTFLAYPDGNVLYAVYNGIFMEKVFTLQDDGKIQVSEVPDYENGVINMAGVYVNNLAQWYMLEPKVTAVWAR
jgi:hypothetical protein